MSMLHIVIVAVLATQTPSGRAVDMDPGARRHRITTTNPVAQQYFDQGLRLVYAAKHAEALRSFRTARRIDPTCAMCYWGEALALGPNVNGPMDAANDVAAQAAIRKAVLHARRVSSHERAYIRALARRYGPDAIASRAQRDTAYARAMHEIVGAFPDDVDAAVLYTEAQMLLSPDTARAQGTQASAPNVRGGTRVARIGQERMPHHPGAVRSAESGAAVGEIRDRADGATRTRD